MSPMRYCSDRNIIDTANMLVSQRAFFGSNSDAIETLLRTRTYVKYRYGRISSDSLKESL